MTTEPERIDELDEKEELPLPEEIRLQLDPDFLAQFAPTEPRTGARALSVEEFAKARRTARRLPDELFVLRRGRWEWRLPGKAGAGRALSLELTRHYEHAAHINRQIHKALRVVRLRSRAAANASAARTERAQAVELMVLALAEVHAAKGAHLNSFIAQRLDITRDAVGRIRSRARKKTRPD